MIISKTPLRISFIGGGTDHLINERSYGSVIATSINKFIYLSLINNHEKKFLINYSLREKVDKINQIRHSIVRETLKYFKIKNPIEIYDLFFIYTCRYWKFYDSRWSAKGLI